MFADVLKLRQLLPTTDVAKLKLCTAVQITALLTLLPSLPDSGRPALLELNEESLQLLSALSAYLAASTLSLLLNVVPEELRAILDEFKRLNSNTSEIIDAIEIHYGNTENRQNSGEHESSPNPVVANKQQATTSTTVPTKPSKPQYCPRKDVRSDQSPLSDNDNREEFDNESLTTTMTEPTSRQTTTTPKTIEKRVNTGRKRAMTANEDDEILSDATYDPPAPNNSVQIGSSSLTVTGRPKRTRIPRNIKCQESGCLDEHILTKHEKDPQRQRRPFRDSSDFRKGINMTLREISFSREEISQADFSLNDDLNNMITTMPFPAKALLKETLTTFSETLGRALSREQPMATAISEQVRNDEFVSWLANCVEDANSRANCEENTNSKANDQTSPTLCPTVCPPPAATTVYPALYCSLCSLRQQSKTDATLVKHLQQTHGHEMSGALTKYVEAVDGVD